MWFSFPLWASHLPAYPDDLAQKGLYGDMFGTLNTLFSALAFCAVAVALIIQIFEFRLQSLEMEEQTASLKLQMQETLRATKASTFIKTTDLLQSFEVRKAREHVFKLGGRKPDFNDWREDHKKKMEEEKGEDKNNNWTRKSDLDLVDTAIQKFDLVGTMGFHGMLDIEMIVDGWGAFLMRSWPILRDYIYKLREEREYERNWNDYEGLVFLAFYYDKYNKLPDEYTGRITKSLDPPHMPRNITFNRINNIYVLDSGFL